MKLDWKHWLPHFITWFLLLAIIVLNIYLLIDFRRTKKRILFGNIKATGKEVGIPFPSDVNDEGKADDSDDK